MAVNEQIVTGRYFRKLIDAASRQWQRFSFWTKASDVEFDDGKTAEAKVGEIDGITSNIDNKNERIAASIKSVNYVNNKFGGVSQFIVDEETGKITGYKTNIGGADTVFPFRRTEEDFVLENLYATINLWNVQHGGSASVSYSCRGDGKVKIVASGDITELGNPSSEGQQARGYYYTTIRLNNVSIYQSDTKDYWADTWTQAINVGEIDHIIDVKTGDVISYNVNVGFGGGLPFYKRINAYASIVEF